MLTRNRVISLDTVKKNANLKGIKY